MNGPSGGMCIHNKPLDRPDICAGCCLLAFALGLVTREQVEEWWGIRIGNLKK